MVYGTIRTAEILRKLDAATRAAKEAGKKCMLGFGWNYYIIMPDKPTLKELDAATHGVSTVIFDSSGHNVFGNSECLRRCGIIDGNINGAWQVGLENERGSIKVGKWGDFVLADRDVFACPVTDIRKTKVVSTWFEGSEAYRAK